MALEAHRLNETDSLKVFNYLINELPIEVLLNLPHDPQLIKDLEARIDTLHRTTMNIPFAIVGARRNKGEKEYYQLVKLDPMLVKICSPIVFGVLPEGRTEFEVNDEQWQLFILVVEGFLNGQSKFSYEGQMITWHQFKRIKDTGEI